MSKECPVCDGTGVEMGGLGWLIWLKCRACGIEWSVKRKEGESWR